MKNHLTLNLLVLLLAAAGSPNAQDNSKNRVGEFVKLRLAKLETDHQRGIPFNEAVGSDALGLDIMARGVLQDCLCTLFIQYDRIAETQASQEQLAREQAKLVAQLAASKKELEQARKDGADAATRRDTVRAESQKADADLAAARTQLQVFVVKQGELTRETSRLEATVERLKKEREALEKEIGRQEAQRQKAPPGGDK
jgi:DNA repair exonuclease SbcCD ATPase subunit